MTPEALVYVLPACICATVTLSLGILFRRELQRFVGKSARSLFVQFLASLEVGKDFLHRNRNRVETVSWPGGVAVITGARGIGFEVIKKLLESDMTVVIGCRNEATGERAVSAIRESGVTKGSAHVYRLDLTSMASIRTFADTVIKNHPHLNLLINNAGVSLDSLTLTEEGVETTFSTNYLGHCYLTHLLLANMAATATATGGQARVVNVSSCIHYFPLFGKVHFDDLNTSANYHEYSAYGQSKLCQMLFTATLNAKLREKRLPVAVFAVHPGIVFTDILRTSCLHKAAGALLRLFLRSPEEGARTTYYACVSPELKSRGGAYIYSCRDTPTGKSAQSEATQAKLWAITMEMLHIQSFGNITP